MIWWQLLGELALLSLLGVGYYFFQKRRYLRWLKEEPQLLAKDLFLYLNSEEQVPDSVELSDLMVALEDFLEQRRDTWPIDELKKFHASIPSTVPSIVVKKLDQAQELVLQSYS